MTKRRAFSPRPGLKRWTSCVSVLAEKSGGGDGRGYISELGYLNWGGTGCALSTWRGASVFTWSGREFRVFKCPPRRASLSPEPGARVMIPLSEPSERDFKWKHPFTERQRRFAPWIYCTDCEGKISTEDWGPSELLSSDQSHRATFLFFFHLSPPFFSTSCTRPLSFITFLVFLSLLLLLLLLLFAVFRHSRFFAKKKRKGTTSLFIERWNTVIIRSRGWTVTFSGATTRVKSVLLFRPPRDRFFDGGRVTWKSSIERGECIIRMVKLCLPPARGDLQLIVYAWFVQGLPFVSKIGWKSERSEGDVSPCNAISMESFYRFMKGKMSFFKMLLSIPEFVRSIRTNGRLSGNRIRSECYGHNTFLVFQLFPLQYLVKCIRLNRVVFLHDELILRESRLKNALWGE